MSQYAVKTKPQIRFLRKLYKYFYERQLTCIKIVSYKNIFVANLWPTEFSFI